MVKEIESRLVSGARELVSHEVLVVDADPTVQKGMVQLLAPSGLHVTAVGTAEKAIELVTHKFFAVVILDLDTPGPNGGLALVKSVHDASPSSLCLVLSPRKSFDAAVLAFRAGAHDVIMKAPDQVDYLRNKILDAAGDAGRRDATLFVEVRDALEEFLRRMMDSDRRVIDLEDQIAGRDTARSGVEEEMRVLCVDADDRLFKALTAPGVAPGFAFTYCGTGGEAIDRVTSQSFHIALVGPMLPDLPGTMVINALRAQAPEVIVISYSPNGRLEVVEHSRSIQIVDKFTAATQLTSRLGELAEAHRAKGRERRYLSSFRERHYDFLRKLSELKKRLEEGSGQHEKK